MREELANTLTHGLGLTMALLGAPVLIVIAVLRGTPLHIFSVSVYGVSLIALYACSTCYHAMQQPAWKQIFKVADHSAIYLLIAGTYTPFTLINMHGMWGWTLFTVVWALALVGVAWKVAFCDRWSVVSTITYLAMGWIVVLAIKPLFQMMPVTGIIWIFAGGAFYTVGVLFFVMERIRYSHAVWHVFVICGSLCHYLAIALYALPSHSA